MFSTTALPSTPATPASAKASAASQHAPPAHGLPSFAQALSQACDDEATPTADTETKPDAASRASATRKGKANASESNKTAQVQPEKHAADAPTEPTTDVSIAATTPQEERSAKPPQPQPDATMAWPAWLPQPRNEPTSATLTATTAATQVTSTATSAAIAADKRLPADKSLLSTQRDATAPQAAPDTAFTAAMHDASPELSAAPASAEPTLPDSIATMPLPTMASASAEPSLSRPGTDTSNTTAPFGAHLSAAIDSPAFAPELGAQVSVFARDGVQQAQLHLNPAEMGPISVQIDVVDSKVQIEFSAANATTRDAIEASLPQLAAALRDGGLTLTGGGVFQQSRGQRDGNDAPAQPGSTHPREREDRDTPTVTTRTAARRGVVDIYA